jgi:RNA polymerase sigma-70 factor (ECF subfamily)
VVFEDRYAGFLGRLSCTQVSRAEAQLREEALLPWTGFEELVRAEQGQLLRIAWRFTHDAEEARDLVQAALADAYERRHTLRDPASGGAWLRRILVHRAINQHRRRRLWSAVEHWFRPASEAIEPSSDSALDRERQLRQVRAAIRDLPARQAAAFTLRYLEGMSLDEVSDALEIDRGTVRVHLYRALAKLKQRLRWKEQADEV